MQFIEPLLNHPAFILLFLVATVALAHWLYPSLKKIPGLGFLPIPFWCYFLPMLATTAGLIPDKSPVYGFFSQHVMPASLTLMLIGVNIPAILTVGRPALTIMFAGSLGIFLGGPMVYAFLKDWMPQEAWKGIGALSASWIGGSANMLAVKEALGTPEHIFASLVIVDTLIAYGWMGILMSLAAFQKQYDRWIGAGTDYKQWEIAVKALPTSPNETNRKRAITSLFLLITFSFALGELSRAAAQKLPELGAVISHNTWTIILVTTFTIVLSFTSLAQLEKRGASRLGYFMLFLLLASIGARANLTALVKSPIFVLAGVLWILFHAVVLLIVGRLLRLPLCFLATASQANVGGPVSAPIVAAVYHPALAPVGLLLAILGNIIGNYLGLLCAQVCYWISRL